MSVAKDLKLSIPFLITYDEFLKHQYYPPNIKGFLIDDVEMLLQRLSMVPINAISLTPGVEQTMVSPKEPEIFPEWP